MVANGAYSAGGPLSGIRVLDMTMWQFGPMCSAMLGDMGADVIKIESLDGDAGRGLWRASTLTMDLGEGRNAYFEACNRNKRGIAVNLKTAEGREVVHRLAKDADVFVQNYRKGVAERLGVGYETLREINPMLVYGSASGYGPEGPDSHLPSFDGCGQARGGLMMSATPPGAEYPTRISQGVSDQMGAIMLCVGVLSALVCRSVQGVGQKVDASHLSANMWLQGLGISMSLLNEGRSFGSYDREAPTNPLSNLYKCKDGRCIQLMHLQPDPYWLPLAKAMGMADAAADARFGDMRGRADHAEELVRVMDAKFAEKTADEWDRLFREFEVDFIYAKVQAIEELEHDIQVQANDYISTFAHPVLGDVKMCSHPNRYSETPAGIRREAPELGQHTEEILLDELGYDWEGIERLQEAGAIL